MDFDLRQLIQRIAWRRTAIIIFAIFALYYYITHKPYFRMLYIKTLMFWHTITKPFYSIGDTFHGTNSEVFNLCVFAMLLITIIGIVKVLRQRQ